MNVSENWIWLPKDKYPRCQHTNYSGFDDKSKGNYTVAEFKRKYSFDKKIVSATLYVSGDTLFWLCCNGEFNVTGPASVGGDFYGNETARDNFYRFKTEIFPNSDTLDFFARVRMMPVQLCDYSIGRGGFMLFATLIFEDGTSDTISSDETWLVRKNGAYCAFDRFDSSVKADEYVFAQTTENLWNTETAPIPVRCETELYPENCTVILEPFEEREQTLLFDKIYAGFIRVKAEGTLCAQVECREVDTAFFSKTFNFENGGEYRGLRLCSVGNYFVKLKNNSDKPAKITLSLITTHYPVYENADTVTDSADINLVLDVCKHTLKYCRQTHHLDSPKHCEPLACTGDYYIESLMTPFSFGDMRLAEFDLLRTAVMLERHDGRMFHTTYSLIWVKMLYDVYMITGNRSLIERCKRALDILLDRFDRYIGENGLIETPPDYMFVDWIYIDNISMHHPPKALGQTCLNMFYYGALDAAEKIYNECGRYSASDLCAQKKNALRDSVNSQLFDAEKGIYFEGLNTPTDEKLICKWMPENVSKRYYLKHSNILAAYVGICDAKTSESIIGKIMNGETEGDIQPYFMHYLLEGIFRNGLREKYTRTVIEKWIAPVKECPKGLVEGFVPPEPTYRFDHSHAWGGTPLYSLPKALLGFEIVEAGMKKIKLSPNLLGFERAKIELLTPYGKLSCALSKDIAPVITAPKEIALVK